MEWWLVAEGRRVYIKLDGFAGWCEVMERMEGSILGSTQSASYPESSSIPTAGSSSSASVKTDQETDEEDEEVEYLSRFRKLVSAFPRAEAIRAGTSPPRAWSM